MKPRPVLISLLLFGSGISALIYQTVWLREFRLIFGSSTAASAAVLAILMGGLAAGSIILGHKVDKKPRRPVRFYALLQLFITISAAASPFLFQVVRMKYIALGGVTAFSPVSGMGLRLGLSILVLVVPTFLMGGTLSAAGRVAETETDSSRRKIALAYGAYTLGAVVGVVISTFYLLEHFGNRMTLWLACGLNLLVSLVAFAVFLASHPVPASAEKISDDETCRTPVAIVLLAATIVGFVFLLMELVWYRMLAPLLGGSTFTSGLILALALLGIGLGSLAYAFFGWGTRPRLSTFALICAAEAFFIAAPYALGDRIAVLTLLLRPLGAFGFCGHVLAWTQIGAIVVLPAAFFVGLQFPMLIAFLGRGRERIGWHIGLIYTCNIVGGIAGLLAGSLSLLPLLSATGAWTCAVIALTGLAAILWITSLVKDRRIFPLAASVLLIAAALLMLRVTGPTSAWRQYPIGAGRVEGGTVTSPNTKEEWLRNMRRYISYQVDGIKSCLGISINSGVSFMINGESNGHAVYDASTQVMIGLLGGILQPHAKRALVLGLGSGSTAGWLGDIASMERVDVMEPERAVLKVAQICAPVNRNVLANPKVRIRIGDAREALFTKSEQYDLIVSEPWNSDRAGVASFYTKEYYDAAARRLRPGGLFLQFVQAYKVDVSTVRSIFTTFAASFAKVETWQTNGTDLLFVGSMEPVLYDAEALRLRIAQEPFKTALTKIWRVTDLEGFLAHYIANDSFTRKMASSKKWISNTDDRNAVEFAFARTVGRFKGFEIAQLREIAHRQGEDRPAITGIVYWSSVIRSKCDDLHGARTTAPTCLQFPRHRSASTRGRAIRLH